MRKVGYIVSLFPCWSETFILNEIIALTDKGCDVTIFSVRSDLERHIHEKAKAFIPKTQYARFGAVMRDVLYWFCRRPRELLALLVLVSCRSYPRFDIWIKNIWSVLEACHFARTVVAQDIAHLHAHFATYPTLVAMAVRRLTDVPFSFTAHAHDIFLDKELLKEKVAAAQTVVAISEYNKNYIMEHCGPQAEAKIKVVHCGLDLREWNIGERSPERHLLVAVGRLTAMKGFAILIGACARLKDKIDFRCQIIGDGPLRGSLEQLINECGLNGKVSLGGVKDSKDVRQAIAHSAVFVAPSIWNDEDGQDGIPLVLMEAMALGTPVVASRISGIPELVEDGVSGLLVAPGQEEELATKIFLLMSDKILASRLVINARRKVEEEFDVGKNVEKLREIFLL